MIPKHKEFLLDCLHGWMDNAQESGENDAVYTAALEVAWICFYLDLITEPTFYRFKKLLSAYRWPHRKMLTHVPAPNPLDKQE